MKNSMYVHFSDFGIHSADQSATDNSSRKVIQKKPNNVCYVDASEKENFVVENV